MKRLLIWLAIPPLLACVACSTNYFLGLSGFWLNYATPHWRHHLLVVHMEDTTLDATPDESMQVSVVYLEFSDGTAIYVSPLRVDEQDIIPGKTRVSYAQLQIDNPVLDYLFAWSDPYYGVATEVVIDPSSSSDQ
ncbi:hypothetical protein [Thermogemmatispora tikiterensis]|uniref:Uncharacterized protein n=1 Tax=Thermogemmatispora tikiterensis TaxID=1825093 RepID=A0A328VDJ7_9CHLR|nr:hypothetical protein [Thermogemmatispora tikiterensis]RAQ94052.1 hypothetical protein A4R35_00810 [Thermogemmatispora tikiterensis]